MSFEKELEKHKEEKDVYEIYNDYKEFSDDVNQKVTSWIGKYWEQIVSLIVAFFLIGIQQFAEPQFNPLFFLRPKFWYEFVPYIMAIWIIIISTLTSNMRWLEDSDQTFINTKKSIKTHVDKDKETPYIFKGARIVDRERKT
jgi:hypothetical protein